MMMRNDMKGPDGVYLGEEKKEIGAHFPIYPSMALLAGSTSTDPAKASSSLFFAAFFTCKRSLPWAP